MTIAATIDLQDASPRIWDIAIVGAGPAGSLAGRELARHGYTVLLIDRASFPRWKVCGCCLNGHALAALRSVGLGPAMAHNGAVPLSRIRLAASGRVADVPLSGSISLSRETFDTILVKAAIQAGVAFLPHTFASLSVGQAFQPHRLKCQAGKPDLGSEVRWLELRQGHIRERVAARLVLAADGLSGLSAARMDGRSVTLDPGARIGAGVVAATGPAFYERGTIFMACGRGGYLGLVRLEDDRLNVAAALDPSWVRILGGPGHAAAELLAEAGLPAVPNLAELGWRGTPALTRQARRRAAERLFLIGDAAGYIEPFTGEGMAWALGAGKAVAPLSAQAVQRWHPRFTYEWESIYRRLLGPRQVVCRAVASVLRSPGLMRTAVRLLTLAPTLATPLTRYLGCAENRKSEFWDPSN
jgi:flavin-dependent dehydrogenase